MGDFEYYDVNRTLSKQRLFNFVLGGRGMGKTYSAKKRVIDTFLKRKKQFVYIRRFDTDLKPSMIQNFFSDIEDIYPDHDFRVGNGVFKIDGDIAGWYIPLSTASRLKSIPFPNVWLIVFDEFIVETGIVHYLPNEVRSFLECYSTISRDRDIQALFLSNAITCTNPYFMYFDISFEQGQTTKLTEFVCVELIRIESFERHMKETKFGRMIEGTEYGHYNIENKFLLDTETFIEKLGPKSVYVCTFIMNGKRIGFHSCEETQLFYLSDKVDASCNNIFTLEINDHSVDTTLAVRVNPFIRVLISNYCEGKLRFTNQEIKNIATTLLKKMI